MTTDGQVEWKIKDGRTHHMCGEIVALVTTPPDYEHLLLCNGQTISADDYPELVEALGTNVLPNLNGRVLQGAETAGEYKEAGLPNITGSIAGALYSNHIDGMVQISARTAEVNNDWRTFDNNLDAVPCVASLDASHSNPIYGASTTVQTPAYTVKFYICWG